MGKLKLGARVRDAEGDIGEIVSKRKGKRLVRYEDTDYGELWNTKDRLTVVDEPGESGEVVPAATFHKGDRAISQNGDYVTVESDVDSAAHVWVSHGTTKWRTPVSWLTKWEPKVGDRVRVCTKEDVWKSGRGIGFGSEGKIKSVNNRELWISFKTNAGYYLDQIAYRDQVEPLPVAPQPAVETSVVSDESVSTATVSDLWRPVVGRFGKTRDGRKVGPILETKNSRWPFEGELEGSDPAFYNADGSCPYLPRRNLVAEWVEPVTEKPWTLADALDGQTVRCDEWAGEYFTPGKTYKIEGTNIRTNHGDVYTIADISTCGGKFSLVSSQPYAIGTRVTLNAPARITGLNGKAANLVLSTGGTYSLPLAALTPTN